MLIQAPLTYPDIPFRWVNLITEERRLPTLGIYIITRNAGVDATTVLQMKVESHTQGRSNVPMPIRARRRTASPLNIHKQRPRHLERPDKDGGLLV